MATHNGQPIWLRQAIDSVISQTYPNWELIIIDDASSTDLVVSDPRIRIFRNRTQLGLTKSLNVGLKHARGEYIARLDDDDLWLSPQKLEKQIAFLEMHPEVALCGTQHTVINEAGHELFRLHFSVTDKEIRERY